MFYWFPPALSLNILQIVIQDELCEMCSQIAPFYAKIGVDEEDKHNELIGKSCNMHV
jgi:hypothetical protein